MVWTITGQLNGPSKVVTPSTHYLRPDRSYRLGRAAHKLDGPKPATVKPGPFDFRIATTVIPGIGWWQLDTGAWTLDDCEDQGNSASAQRRYTLALSLPLKDGASDKDKQRKIAITRTDASSGSQQQVIVKAGADPVQLEPGDRFQYGLYAATVEWVPVLVCFMGPRSAPFKKDTAAFARKTGLVVAFKAPFAHHTHVVAPKIPIGGRPEEIDALFLGKPIAHIQWWHDLEALLREPARPQNIPAPNDGEAHYSYGTRLAPIDPDVGWDFNRYWGHCLLEKDFTSFPDAAAAKYRDEIQLIEYYLWCGASVDHLKPEPRRATLFSDVLVVSFVDNDGVNEVLKLGTQRAGGAFLATAQPRDASELDKARQTIASAQQSQRKSGLVVIPEEWPSDVLRDAALKVFKLSAFPGEKAFPAALLMCSLVPLRPTYAPPASASASASASAPAPAPTHTTILASAPQAAAPSVAIADDLELPDASAMPPSAVPLVDPTPTGHAAPAPAPSAAAPTPQPTEPQPRHQEQAEQPLPARRRPIRRAGGPQASGFEGFFTSTTSVPARRARESDSEGEQANPPAAQRRRVDDGNAAVESSQQASQSQQPAETRLYKGRPLVRRAGTTAQSATDAFVPTASAAVATTSANAAVESSESETEQDRTQRIASKVEQNRRERAAAKKNSSPAAPSSPAPRLSDAENMDVEEAPQQQKGKGKKKAPADPDVGRFLVAKTTKSKRPGAELSNQLNEDFNRLRIVRINQASKPERKRLGWQEEDSEEEYERHLRDEDEARLASELPDTAFPNRGFQIVFFDIKERKNRPTSTQTQDASGRPNFKRFRPKDQAPAPSHSRAPIQLVIDEPAEMDIEAEEGPKGKRGKHAAKLSTAMLESSDDDDDDDGFVRFQPSKVPVTKGKGKTTAKGKAASKTMDSESDDGFDSETVNFERPDDSDEDMPVASSSKHSAPAKSTSQAVKGKSSKSSTTTSSRSQSATTTASSKSKAAPARGRGKAASPVTIDEDDDDDDEESMPEPSRSGRGVMGRKNEILLESDSDDDPRVFSGFKSTSGPSRKRKR